MTVGRSAPGMLGFPLGPSVTDKPLEPTYFLLERIDHSSHLAVLPSGVGRIDLGGGSGLEWAWAERGRLGGARARYLIERFPPPDVSRLGAAGEAAPSKLGGRVLNYSATSDYGAGVIALKRSSGAAAASRSVSAGPAKGTVYLVSIAHSADNQRTRFGRIIGGDPDDEIRLLYKWRAAWIAKHNHGSAALALLAADAMCLQELIARGKENLKREIENDAAKLGIELAWSGDTPDVLGIEAVPGAIEGAEGPLLVGVKDDQLDDLVALVDGGRSAVLTLRDEGACDAPRDSLFSRIAAAAISFAAGHPWTKYVLGAAAVAAVVGYNVGLNRLTESTLAPDAKLVVEFPQQTEGGASWDDPEIALGVFSAPDIHVRVGDDATGYAADCPDSQICVVPLYEGEGGAPWAVRVFEEDTFSCAPCDPIPGGEAGEECRRDLVAEAALGIGGEKTIRGVSLRVVREADPNLVAALEEARVRSERALCERAADMISEAPPGGAAGRLMLGGGLASAGILAALLVALLVAAILVLWMLGWILDAVRGGRRAWPSGAIATLWRDLDHWYFYHLSELGKKIGVQVQDARFIRFKSLIRRKFDLGNDVARAEEPFVLFRDWLILLANSQDALDESSPRTPDWHYYRRSALASCQFGLEFPLVIVGLLIASVFTPLVVVGVAGYSAPGVFHPDTLIVALGAAALPFVALVWILRHFPGTEVTLHLLDGRRIEAILPHSAGSAKARLEEWFTGIGQRPDD